MNNIGSENSVYIDDPLQKECPILTAACPISAPSVVMPLIETPLDVLPIFPWCGLAVHNPFSSDKAVPLEIVYRRMDKVNDVLVPDIVDGPIAEARSRLNAELAGPILNKLVLIRGVAIDSPSSAPSNVCGNLQAVAYFGRSGTSLVDESRVPTVVDGASLLDK